MLAVIYPKTQQENPLEELFKRERLKEMGRLEAEFKTFIEQGGPIENTVLVFSLDQSAYLAKKEDLRCP